MVDQIDSFINGGSKDVAAVYFNFPHDPTGMHNTFDENKKIMDVMEAANTAGRNIVRIDDIPYFGGCDQREGSAQPYLQVGYKDVLTADSKTLWAAVFRFSKAFGTANPGFTRMVTHPENAGEGSKRVTRSTGLAYVPEFFEHLAEILKEENDAEVRAHFAALNVKYKQNRKSLEEMFGDMVIDGDPGMTSLIAVPDEAFGRDVVCADGQTRTMADLNDIIEYLGNMGVVTVNNGGNLLRLAQAVHAEKFVEGITRLKTALDTIQSSPKAKAA